MTKMKIAIPSPRKVLICPWHVQLPELVEEEALREGNENCCHRIMPAPSSSSPPPPPNRHSPSSSSSSSCSSSSSRMTHHPAAAAGVHYQLSSSAGPREQFEFIDGGNNTNTNTNDLVKRQFSTSSIPQGEPHRLIAGEPTSGMDPQLNSQFAAIIFGPFYGLSKPFFSSEFGHQRRLSPKVVLCIVLFVLLIGRSIFYFGQLGQSLNLSLDWARASLQVSLTLNAVGALGWMQKNGGFLRQFITQLAMAIGHNQTPKSSMGTMVFTGVVAIFVLFTSSIWALLRVLELQMNVQVKSVMTNGSFEFDFLKNGQPNGFSFETFFHVSLVSLDAFLAVLSGFISAVALAIFHLSFRSVLAEWKAFKAEQIDENTENGRLMHFDVLNRVNQTASPLLKFAHFTSNKFEQLGTGMFMTAIFCNISATFIGGVTGIKESSGDTPAVQWPLYEVLEKVNNFCWSIMSIMLLAITVKGPYDVHSKIREIKEQLFLENGIWSSEDPRLTSLAQNLVRRLGGIRIHRIGTQLFQLIFIAQMVLVWLLISGSSNSSSIMPKKI